MGKRRPVKRSKPTSPSTSSNKLVLVGAGVAGVLFVALIIFLIIRRANVESLATYCDNTPGACVSMGEDNAPVTMVEVADYGCIHCRNFHIETLPSIVREYVDTGRVRLVVLPYALSDTTKPATNAGMCAAEQGEYFAFSEVMFNRYDDPSIRTREGFLAAASSVGIEMTTFTQCVDAGRYNDVISDNIRIARQNSVSSTPTFFLNDAPLRGAFPFDTFKQRIDALP